MKELSVFVSVRLVMDVKDVLRFLLTVVMTSPVVSGQAESADVSQYAPKPGLFSRLESPTDKTIDQLITDALGGIDVASNKILAPGAYVLAELDMYLSQDQFLNLYDPPSSNIQRGPNSTQYLTSSRQKRKATRDVILRWPNAEIPYQLAQGDFQEKEVYMLKQAMTEWERYTCLKFRPAASNDRNILRFQNGEGCNSQLGMVGGVQLLNLDISGCRFKGLYLHEIGHAIGLVHEHQLPDRDRYIDILLQNVAPHFRIFFNRYSPAVVNQFDVPYEYSSVMHYGITAFSYNGKAQTIRTKDRSKEESIGRVYLKELSFSDVKVVNQMYGCSAFCTDLVTCVDDGYLDQNCRCVCPDGTDSCEVKKEKPADDKDDDDGDGADDDKKDDTGTERCENKYEGWKCAVWANQGECDRNPLYMKQHCKRACGLCDSKTEQKAKNHFTTWAWQWFGMFTNLFPQDWMIGVCKDVYSYEKCYKWKEQGDCVTNEMWMEKHCKMTCNFCGNPAFRPETNCRNHHDDAKCDKWALDGECVLNAKWMRDRCQRSCRACADTLDTDTQDDEEEEEEDMSCVDKHSTGECRRWAEVGECSNNPTWMIANCRKSCDKCDDGTCKNLYDDNQCAVWEEDGECMKNYNWMHKNCGRSCGACHSNDTRTDTGTGRGTETGTGSGTDTGSKPDKDRGSVTRRPDVTQRTTVRTTLQPDTESCYNVHNDVECHRWAETGHCDINPLWMHVQCMKSCHRCGPGTGKGDGEEVCRDRDAGCAGWADHGYCDSNPRYNLIYCKKSCDNCNGCRDEQFLCALWAKAGHCQSNAGFMLRECQRSCATCE